VAHSERQRENIDGFKPFSSGRFKKRARLLCCERMSFRPYDARRVN